MTAVISSGLCDRRLDALLVSGAPNIRYLTGFTGDNGNVLVTHVVQGGSYAGPYQYT